MPKLFAWADSDIHEESYEERSEAECSVWYEDDQFFTLTFDEWRCTFAAAANGIGPYATAGGGEVEYFRIELTLNVLGKAFLIVDKFASDGVRQLTV